MEQQLPFHMWLERELERRLWSQADLAEKIESDTKTVSRWVNNEALPSIKSRRKLTEVFEKSMEEMGLPSSVKTPIDAPVPDETADKTTGPIETPMPFHEEWSGAPQTGSFYGREQEIEQLKEWIVGQRAFVVAIVGLGGMGKTTLATHVANSVKSNFEFLIWHSLQNAPPLEHILRHWLSIISLEHEINLPESPDEQFNLLLQYLQRRRCLLILDNVESILQSGERAGQYRPKYDNYGRLLEQLSQTRHKSCLLFTSREKPKELAQLEGKTTHLLELSGVDVQQGQDILETRNLKGTSQEWNQLVKLYSGNPLALKLISDVIDKLFGRDIASFLEKGETTFGDVNALLENQFARLPTREQELLYWLAIEREPVTLESVYANLVAPVMRGERLEILESLRRRFLIEARGSDNFSLQPVIMEYMTHLLIRKASEEFIKGAPDIWMNYAFMKAQAKDYVRASQRRLLLGPIVEHLNESFYLEEVQQLLMQWLEQQRQKQPRQRNYLAANVLHVLIEMQANLRDANFSSLVIRQPYLQNISLHGVDFSHAQFMDPMFTNTFGNILSTSFSHSENKLAVGTATGNVWIYKVPEGTLQVPFTGHEDGVWSLAFNNDDTLLASGSDDFHVRVWDARTGRSIHDLTEHSGRVRSVAFSPDSRWLASGSDDSHIRIWNVETGECERTLSGHSGRVWSVAFSPDGQFLASGSTDTTVRLWDVEKGTCVRVFEGHGNAIRSLAFNHDGTRIATASDDGTVRLWQRETGEPLHVLREHTNRVWSVAFHGNLLVSGSEDHTIRLWDAETGVCKKVLSEHTHGVRSVSVNAEGKLLVSGGDDQTMRFWSLETGECLKALHGYTSRVRSITINPKGTLLASSSEDKSIRVWSLATYSKLKTIQSEKHGALEIAFNMDGTQLASGGEDMTVHLWNVKTGQDLNTLQGHTNWVRPVAFSPDGKVLATGGEDKVIRLWDIKQPGRYVALEGHTSSLRALVFSPDSKYLISGGDDDIIRVWLLSKGECVAELEGHKKHIRSLAFSPKGTFFASGSEDQTVRLWDGRTFEFVRVLHGHDGWVRSLAFSADGMLIASCGDDCTVRLWEVETGNAEAILEDHTARVRSLAFLPDSNFLASGSDDGTIIIWNVKKKGAEHTLINERPYEKMKITGVHGLTEAQKNALYTLGAIEDEE